MFKIFCKFYVYNVVISKIIRTFAPDFAPHDSGEDKENE